MLYPFTGWLPRWQAPAGTSAGTRALIGTEEIVFFDYAAGLEVGKMTVIETFGAKYKLAELVTTFQRICDAAREHNVLVQVEFMAFGSIPDLATAWEIVRRAGRDNGGLVFDTWHYFRTQPDPALLAQQPGEKLFAVQVADAATALQGGSLLADQMHFRRVPGKGDFPLADVMDTLRASGGLRLVAAGMGLTMGLVLSFVMTVLNVGLGPQCLLAWGRSFGIGVLISIPTALLVTPHMHKLATRLT